MCPCSKFTAILLSLESLESVCALTCVDVYVYTTNISYRYLRQTQGEREGEREHIL